MARFRWLLKLPFAAALCLIPAVAITVLLASIYFWETVDAGCDCYATKMSLSAVAFQKNVDTIRMIVIGVLLLLTAVLTAIPWSKHRLIESVCGLIFALIIWISYGDQPYTHEYYKRWTMVPLDRISVSLTTEYSDSIALIARHRFVAAFSGFVICLIIGESIHLTRRFRSRRNDADQSSTASASEEPSGNTA